MAARSYPYSFHVALDGSGLNGLEGRAGVCVFRYDPADNSYAYKVSYFSGVAGGHAVSVSPEHTAGFLGNTGQHLFFYDPASLDESDRVSTLRFEVADHSLKSSTHLVWLDDVQFVTAIGEHLWRFDINLLKKAERIGPHHLKLPHAMKRTASGRYVVYGGMDHPDRGEAARSESWTSAPARRVGSPCRPRAGTWQPTPPRICSTRSPSGWHPKTGVTTTSGRCPTSRSTSTRSMRRPARWCGTGLPAARSRPTSTPT